MANRKVALRARDVQVLELLAERKVETLNDLHARYWPDGSRKTAYNRLNDLARAGYLEHVKRPEPNGTTGAGRPRSEHLYVLGPKASIALRLRKRDAHKLARSRMKSGTADALIDHQLATNRVGDYLNTRLVPDDPAVPESVERRRRADAHYRATPDSEGRDVVLVEIDLGHYSRSRVLAKIHGFYDHPQARSILFATPTVERADQVAHWAREAYGDDVMRRLQVFSFDELRGGVRLAPGTEPVHADPTTPARDASWYRTMMGPSGSR